MNSSVGLWAFPQNAKHLRLGWRSAKAWLHRIGNPVAEVALELVLHLHSHCYRHLNSFPCRSSDDVGIAAVVVFDDRVFIGLSDGFVDGHVLVVVPRSMAVVSG